MKKKVINGLLILAIITIYGAIFGLQDDLFGDIEDDSQQLVKSEYKNTPNENNSIIDFSHSRNYFFPVKRNRIKAAKANSKIIPKPTIKIDTLAVIGSGKKAKYLLRNGDKVWID